MSENGLVATKQQYQEKMLRRYKSLYNQYPDDETVKRVLDGSGIEFDRFSLEGFVVLNKKALFGRLTSGNAKAEIANKLIKEILGDKPE